MNALAATAAALAMGAPLAAISKGLEDYAGVKGRLQHSVGLNGAVVIDDSYNANPMSMKAAIDVLMAKPGKKIIVLGDMGELGENEAELHTEIGNYAKTAGADALFTLGNLSENMTKAFNVNNDARATHYLSVSALTADLIKKMQPDTTVLVKGSRFMAMERVVNEITNKADHYHGEKH